MLFAFVHVLLCTETYLTLQLQAQNADVIYIRTHKVINDIRAVYHYTIVYCSGSMNKPPSNLRCFEKAMVDYFVLFLLTLI